MDAVCAPRIHKANGLSRRSFSFHSMSSFRTDFNPGYDSSSLFSSDNEWCMSPMSSQRLEGLAIVPVMARMAPADRLSQSSTNFFEDKMPVVLKVHCFDQGHVGQSAGSAR